jgi:uncharacterized membrane protein
METKRIEALADGVFAIAMTLLVIELHVPVLAAGEGGADLLHKLREMVPHILAYAVSFLVIGTFWIGHHFQYAHIRRVDRTFLWINVVFLLAIAFLPFATALIGEHWQYPAASMVYGGTLLVAGTALYAHWAYAAGGRRLTAADLSPEVDRRVRHRVMAGWAVYAAATLLAPASTTLALLIFALMPVVYMLPWGVDRHLKT